MCIYVLQQMENKFCMARHLAPERLERGGWPLLTVETEVNGDSESTNGGALTWLVRWACRAVPVQEIFALSWLL
jgi:hypothetical protein